MQYSALTIPILQVDEPVTEEAVIEDSVVQEPIAKEPGSKEPTTKEPATEQSLAEEVVFKQRSTEDMADEEKKDFKDEKVEFKAAGVDVDVLPDATSHATKAGQSPLKEEVAVARCDENNGEAGIADSPMQK
ncbi:hypothetical protein EG327_005117 [Venturia inaequalis]|uniref:Uncharacterized protein n=1 Tax=Venturia inaequalis TaxID=5025 RepID=A0A8H3VVC5_VENIN|nr:hypothetical protein EG327_005117 [Venturia inaequalis]